MDRTHPRSVVLASLSHTLDLAEGQPRGHAVRSCLIGMQIAEEAGLGPGERWDLFYALLLKDAGGSAASEVAWRVGCDDRVMKRLVRSMDWTHPLTLVRYGLGCARPARSVLGRAHRAWRLVRGGRGLIRELSGIRGVRGAEIARALGFPPSTAAAIRSVDEHWDGRGHPRSLSGRSIPVVSRIVCLAQTAEVFLQAGGPDAVLEVVRERRGRWFDPELADVVLGWGARTDWWSTVRVSRDAESLRGVAPRDRAAPLGAAELDRIAEVWADIVDAKSRYTRGHSRRVAARVGQMAASLDVAPREECLLRRAGLLHDLGKLETSNRILDKEGGLDQEEWRELREHPRRTLQLLQRVPPFREVARLAAHHHERLDGSGYPWGLGADRLGIGARMLAVADAFEAFTEGRPFRDPVPPRAALDALRGEAGTRLDRGMVDLLSRQVLDGGNPSPRSGTVHGGRPEPVLQAPRRW